MAELLKVAEAPILGKMNFIKFEFHPLETCEANLDAYDCLHRVFSPAARALMRLIEAGYAQEALDKGEL